MEKIILNEAQKIWTEIAQNKTPKNIELEVEVYKKLINIFQVGEYYYMIFNPPEMVIEFASESITKILGYTPEEFTIEKFFSCVHPEDLPYFMDFEATVTQFFTQLPPKKVMKYKTRYDYRLKKADGNYIRILQQNITIQSDDDGAVLRTLVIHTDISLLKSDNRMSLSFIGLEGEPSYHDVKTVQKFSPSTEIFTKREKEVLYHMSQNLQSKEIADLLHISISTVSTHRKNIYKKTETTSLLELINMAFQKGWL